MEAITSTRNPRVREVVELHRARNRRATGRHLVEGPNAVGEALRAGVVEEVFALPEAVAGLDAPAGVPVTAVAEHVLERLADTVTPQGVVAVARTVVASLREAVGPVLTVVLHEVSDPGNLGTIVRTADGAGAGGIVVTRGSADPFAPKAVRASAGSCYHLPVVVDVAIEDVLPACRAAGQAVLGLDAGADTEVFELVRGTQPVALVLGNEAHGLPGALLAQLDGCVAVPILGRAESLNVAAAAAVALYAAAQGLRAAGVTPTGVPRIPGADR